jgi:hypothetical protein
MTKRLLNQQTTNENMRIKMARFIHLTQVKGDQYDEETGAYTEHSFPTTVNVETIRCFYPRHDGKAGTRITFADGGGFPVQEAFDKVLVLVGASNPAAPLALESIH